MIGQNTDDKSKYRW